MQRHDRDDTSLVAGLLFLALGAAYLLDAVTGISIDARWVLPVLLIGLGLAGLAASLPRALRSPEQAAPPGSPDPL